MWDIPSWLPIMDSLKPILTGTGTAALYFTLALSIVSQVGVVLFGAYKVRKMFRDAEE